MAIQLITPRNSFIRFDGEIPTPHCIWGENKTCLPIYAESDVAFQFVISTDTIEEADAFCQIGSSGIQIGLVSTCDQPGFDVEFTDDQPERYRIAPTQVLYNWPHGFPGMLGFYDINQCFFIRIAAGGNSYCSNCFQRIGNDCFTSVVEYGNDENAFGFNYCGAGSNPIDENASCEPTRIEFANKSTLVIPYTAGLASLYGQVPTVQVWLYDTGGQLYNPLINATFDALPPTTISFDFGGPASGVIIIR